MSGTALPPVTATAWIRNSSSTAAPPWWGWRTPGFVQFRARAGRDLTDREASYVAAEYLKERLEEEDERPLYDVSPEDLLRLIDKLGIH